MPPHPHLHSGSTPAVVAIFALTYLGIAVGRVPGLKLDRTGIVLLGAIAMVIFSGMPTVDAVALIHWPTILLLFSLLVLSAQLRLSGFFGAVARTCGDRLGHPARFLLALILTVAGLSAVLNNDVVGLAFASVIIEPLRRKGLNPVPFLVAVAVAANIGAAATVVGNPQNMLIGQVARLQFGPYLGWCIGPVVFALGCAYGIIWLMSRRRLSDGTDGLEGKAPVLLPIDRGHTIKGLIILAVVIALFFTSLPREMVALTAAGIHLASPKFKTKDLLDLVDWQLLVLFMGLFVVTGAFEATGAGDRAAQWLYHRGFDLNHPTNLVLATAGLSNLISNAAAVMLLLKMVNVSIASAAYALALANSFGGSLIVVGSVANIIVVQKAREQGVNISFREFARLGVPVTLAALAGLILWLRLMA